MEESLQQLRYVLKENTENTQFSKGLRYILSGSPEFWIINSGWFVK